MNAIVRKFRDGPVARIITYQYEALIAVVLLYKIAKFKYLPFNGSFQRFVAVCGLLVLIVCFTLVAGRLLRRTDRETRDCALIFAAFFLLSYTSNAILLLDAWFIGYNAIGNALLIIGAVYIFYHKEKQKTRWMLPALCFVCTAVQPHFIYTLLPMMIVFSFHKGKTKHNIALYNSRSIAMVVAAVASFLLLGLKRTVFQITDMKSLIVENALHLAFSILIVLPIIIVFLVLWFRAFKLSKDETARKTLVFIAALPLTSVLYVFMTPGYLNPIMVAVFAQFCFLFYFFHINDKAVVSSFLRVGQFFLKNMFILFLTVIYLASFSGFTKFVLSTYGSANGLFSLWG